MLRCYMVDMVDMVYVVEMVGLVKMSNRAECVPFLHLEFLHSIIIILISVKKV